MSSIVHETYRRGNIADEVSAAIAIEHVHRSVYACEKGGGKITASHSMFSLRCRPFCQLACLRRDDVT